MVNEVQPRLGGTVFSPLCGLFLRSNGAGSQKLNVGFALNSGPTERRQAVLSPRTQSFLFLRNLKQLRRSHDPEPQLVPMWARSDDTFGRFTQNRSVGSVLLTNTFCSAASR